MAGHDSLSLARGRLAAVLDVAADLPLGVALEVCDALNHLQMPGAPPEYGDLQGDGRAPTALLRDARKHVVRALPALHAEAGRTDVAGSLRCIHAALAGLAAR